MIEKIIQHLARLVEFRTTQDRPDQIGACFQYIRDALNFFPFVENLYTVKNDAGVPVKSAVWVTQPTRHPRLMLYCHIDVVPASEQLFKMTLNNGKAIGRGVYDMKFAVATYIEVLRRLASEHGSLPSVGLFLTSDEEIGGQFGTRYLLDNEGYRADVVLMPDGGKHWTIVEEAKGLMYVEIRTRGKTAHASRPWRGDNAIDRLINIAHEIRRVYPISISGEDWTTTVNFSRIVGGTQTALNQVADESTLYLDVRYPFNNSPEDTLRSIVQKFGDPATQMTVSLRKSAFFQDKQNTYVQRWAHIIRQYSPQNIFVREDGTADHHYFSQHGIPTIVSQPIGDFIHTDEEQIDVASLASFADKVSTFIQTF